MQTYFKNIRLFFLGIILTIASLLTFTQTVQAQNSIGGSNCVVPGNTYFYYIVGSINSSWSITWCINNGTITGVSYNQCRNGQGYSVATISVVWSGTSTGWLSLNTPSGYSTFNVTMTSAIYGGNISNLSQTIDYNHIPTGISCTPASGGACTTPSYQYQWQSSPNALNWSNISGATGLNYSPGALTSPTYYRRTVNEYSTGSYAESNVAVVYVNPNMSAGVITSPVSNAIDYNTSPGTITGTTPSGGNCGVNYEYQWQQSVYYAPFTDITGASGINYTPGALPAATKFRRKVTCGEDFIFSNEIEIAVAVNPDETLNYIRVKTIFKPGITNVSSALLLSDPQDMQQTTQYFDGLGRLEQTVNRKASGTAPFKDIVLPVEYDIYGRQFKNYLPYVSPVDNGIYRANAAAEQNTFNSNFFSSQSEQYFYGESEVELSPLNRVMKTFAPGISWVGTKGTGSEKSVQQTYLINTDADAVRIWNIADAPGSLPQSPGAYLAGQLYKNVSADEEGKKTIEYKDKEGKVVLKKVQLSNTLGDDHVGWLSTYYVFDKLGQLRFVLQPRAIELIQGSWTVSSAIAEEFCFRYEYDARMRMIIKQPPGAKALYMIYDARDRVVMTQDGNQRLQNQWLFTKYDAINRPIATGFYTNANPAYANQVGMQGLLNNQGLGYSEVYNPANYPIYSLSNTFPSVSPVDVLSYTYYDTYNWSGWHGPLWDVKDNSYDANFDSPSNNFPFPQGQVQSNRIVGMMTGRWQSAGGGMLSVSYYDDRGRVIQSRHYNMTAGKDVIATQYDFSGKILKSVISQNKAGSRPNTHNIFTNFDYDYTGRLVSIRKRVDSNTDLGHFSTVEKKIVQNSYNELGQLQVKKLSPDFNSGNGMETLEHDYNVRGWLTTVNKSYLDGTTQRWFGVELSYDKTNSVAGGTYLNSQTNGNISGTTWKTRGAGLSRRYDFEYDNVNRLSKAVFTQNNSGSTWDASLIDFSLGSSDLSGKIIYDENGNILKMQSRGFKVGAPVIAPIDDLTYTYQDQSGKFSNKLQQVTDQANDKDSKLGDFKYDPANKTSTDYTYDDNGNLISDKNKGITSITYNYLNLPITIAFGTKGSIEFLYDCFGVKLRKIVHETGQADKTTHYMLGGIVYENDVVQFIPHEEGRIRFKPSTTILGTTTPGRFIFDYFVKDHLGNIRQVLTEELEQSIYPAVTLEGTGTGTDPVLKEQEYYKIVSGNIVSASSATGISNYQNNNGNPPVNNNPNCNNTSVIKQTDLSTKLYQLNGNTNKTGLGITLKVMAGDHINVYGKSYYFQNNPGGTPGTLNDLATEILSALLGTPMGVGADKALVSDLTSSSSLVNAVIGNLNEPGRTAGGGNVPKAAINFILLDDQFRYVDAKYSPVGSANNIKDHHTDGVMQNIEITRNGYIYVFVSNESPMNVFFDNLQIIHDKGPLVEETHYYPFGLTMAGISSKALNYGLPENKRKFNSGSELQTNEFSDGSGLEWYSTQFRMYDPQLGRWHVTDPRPTEMFSPYAGMDNNPILKNDPLGDTTRLRGFAQKEVLGWFGKGLRVKDANNPFFFNKKGDLQFSQKKLDKLSETQKGIASNIIGTIKSTRVFTLARVKENDVFASKMDAVKVGDQMYQPMYHMEGKEYEQLTMKDIGGAITEVDKDGNVTSSIAPELFNLNNESRLKMNGFDGNEIPNPVWLVGFHELGGHGFYGYTGDQSLIQKTLTLDYENLIRGFVGLECRPYDDNHPDPQKK